MRYGKPLGKANLRTDCYELSYVETSLSITSGTCNKGKAQAALKHVLGTEYTPGMEYVVPTFTT